MASLIPITKAKMALYKPYLTKSAVKYGDRYCSVCNRSIESSDIKLGIHLKYSNLAIICKRCIEPYLNEMMDNYQEALKQLKAIDLNKLFGDGNKMDNFGIGPFSIGPRAGVTTITEVQSINNPVPVSSSGIGTGYYGSPCKTCTKKYFIKKPPEVQQRHRWSANSQWTVVETIGQSIAIEGTTYCSKCAVDALVKLVEEYKEIYENLHQFPEIAPVKYDLKYPTTGTVHSDEGFYVANVERNTSCTRCSTKLERTCVRITDHNTDTRGLCIKCAKEHIENKLKSYQAALLMLDDVQEDRCYTCPMGVQARCISRGIDVKVKPELSGEIEE